MKLLKYILPLTLILAALPRAANAESLDLPQRCAFETVDDKNQETTFNAKDASLGSCGDEPLYIPGISSMNWSGYSVLAPTGVSYRSVSARITVPKVSRTCSNSALGTWVGLGGMTSHRLIQAGVGFRTTSNTPYLWAMLLSSEYEVLSYNITTVPIRQGDQLDIQVTYAPSAALGPNVGHAIFSFTNQTTGATNATTPLKVAVDGSLYYDGKTAEWIDERPLVNQSLANLLDFDYINWSLARVMDEQTRTWGNLTSENESRISMINFNSYSPIALPEMPSSSSSFKDVYIACY